MHSRIYKPFIAVVRINELEADNFEYGLRIVVLYVSRSLSQCPLFKLADIKDPNVEVYVRNGAQAATLPMVLGKHHGLPKSNPSGVVGGLTLELLIWTHQSLTLISTHRTRAFSSTKGILPFSASCHRESMTYLHFDVRSHLLHHLKIETIFTN
jgi:hypothetical protein